MHCSSTNFTMKSGKEKQMLKSWKEAIIQYLILIYKTGKEPSGYRSISPTCSLCKILQKIVLKKIKRLNSFLDE